MRIPILRNHDHTQVIGVIEATDTGLRAEFTDPLTRDEFFSIFPGAGARVLEQLVVDNIEKILVAEILEVSVVGLGA